MEKKPVRFVLFVRGIATIVFLIIIFEGLCGVLRFLDENCYFNPHNLDNYFQDINGKSSYIDIYGLCQKGLGKRQIENFTIFMNSYHELIAPKEEIDEEAVISKIDEIQPIFDHLYKVNIPFLYVSPPLPIAEVSDLPYGVEDYSHKNVDLLHDQLDDSIHVLDISEVTKLQKENRFYRTDHHWSGDAVFEAYQLILGWMEAEGILPEQTIPVDADNFERITVDHFLGSYGVKVGKYYNGEEQYVYYQPQVDTQFTCTTTTPDEKTVESYSGSWYEALMDSSMLVDSDYHNKYNAALWGNGGENRIVNHDLSFGKLLIVSHSYGRPLAQYFALNFHEVCQIDPQEGRFSGNYLSYIDEYQPDVVLFLVEFEGEIIGVYRTTDEG